MEDEEGAVDSGAGVFQEDRESNSKATQYFIASAIRRIIGNGPDEAVEAPAGNESGPVVGDDVGETGSARGPAQGRRALGGGKSPECWLKRLYGSTAVTSPFPVSLASDLDTPIRDIERCPLRLPRGPPPPTGEAMAGEAIEGDE